MTDFTTPSRRQALSLIAATTAGVALPEAFAQSGKWPQKPIRIVVAFPPGGLTDAYARMYAEQLSAKLGVSVVVDNKPGAGAIIGIDAVAKSPPDGYTLLMTTSGTVWQNRVLYTKLPYNLDKDLTPIANFPSGPLVMGVSDKVPSKTIQEFIEFAKTNQTSMGTYAPGSYPHMVAGGGGRRAVAVGGRADGRQREDGDECHRHDDERQDEAGAPTAFSESAAHFPLGAPHRTRRCPDAPASVRRVRGRRAAQCAPRRRRPCGV